MWNTAISTVFLLQNQVNCVVGPYYLRKITRDKSQVPYSVISNIFFVVFDNVFNVTIVLVITYKPVLELKY